MDLVLEAVKRDFAPIRDLVLGVLLYGSQATGRAHVGSDVDVCVVAGPGREPYDALRGVWTRAHLGKAEYDVKVFEDLPLYLKGEVLDTGRLVESRDEVALSEYLRPVRKVWDGQAHRNRPNEADWQRILAARRRQSGR